ncbi:MAG: cysteine synthase A [Clostridium sp.]|nr:cysteine synthase A [Clostridium sp.]
MIAQNITDLIGFTPMMRLYRYEASAGINAHIYVKIESFNPGGSIKDRVALSMIDDAAQKGILKPGATIIEPTSGNTGIGLAMVGSARGYKVILTMPETMSVERRKLLQAYGAQLELTPGSKGMAGAIERANELQREMKGSVILGQFDNPANPKVHYMTTGVEIADDMQGRTIDFFVAGVGTGGTITGCARRLKQTYPSMKAVAVEPAKSPVLSGGNPGPHGIMGIGAGFVPANYDASVVDEVMQITDEEAKDAMRALANEEGLLAGISSGAALCAAAKLASRPENKGKTFVVILPDTGERYLSVVNF